MISEDSWDSLSLGLASFTWVALPGEVGEGGGLCSVRMLVGAGPGAREVTLAPCPSDPSLPPPSPGPTLRLPQPQQLGAVLPQHAPTAAPAPAEPCYPAPGPARGPCPAPAPASERAGPGTGGSRAGGHAHG